MDISSLCCWRHQHFGIARGQAWHQTLNFSTKGQYMSHYGTLFHNNNVFLAQTLTVPLQLNPLKSAPARDPLFSTLALITVSERALN
ncbi:hypothetical protein XELAEV_18011116mg [Xenopus laevis]|uniref:Uncharacterized protein n=1 Tax=Xenopus laevis TaxID=8355 RepID=A0A974I2K8_XENLA|nr:hypothetical protein XELAEV_18011116mg [Xenopus laevis]